MDTLEIFSLLGGLTGVASFIGALVAWRRAISDDRKSKSDSASSVATAAAELIDDIRQDSIDMRNMLAESRANQNALQETLDHALARIDALECERTSLIKRIRALESELSELKAENAALRKDNIALVRQISGIANGGGL